MFIKINVNCGLDVQNLPILFVKQSKFQYFECTFAFAKDSWKLAPPWADFT